MILNEGQLFEEHLREVIFERWKYVSQSNFTNTLDIGEDYEYEGRLRWWTNRRDESA
jgi:hypothetical protein